MLETLIAKQASLPRELYSPRAEERARNLKKEENDEDDSSDSPQASGVPYDGGSSTEDDESMEIDLEENEISKALAADTIPPERLSSHENDVVRRTARRGTSPPVYDVRLTGFGNRPPNCSRPCKKETFAIVENI